MKLEVTEQEWRQIERCVDYGVIAARRELDSPSLVERCDLLFKLKMERHRQRITAELDACRSASAVIMGQEPE